MFQVEWLQTALNELANIWLRAESAVRQRITQAAHAVDQTLQLAPVSQGESREEGERVAFFYPLGIQFEVDEDRRIVRILNVWDIRRKK